MEHYLDPQKQEESHQLTADELHLRHQRITGPDAWSNKNGGACAYCGGHDGMVSLRRYMFIDAPPAENEVFYAGGQGMYEPCPECNPASVIVSYYRRMAHAEAVAWASAQEEPSPTGIISCVVCGEVALDGSQFCNECNEIDELFNEVMDIEPYDPYFKEPTAVYQHREPASQIQDSREAAQGYESQRLHSL